MSGGNFDVPPHHKYRVVIPGMVAFLRAGLPAEADSPKVTKALFYGVNLLLGGIMLALSHRALAAHGFLQVTALLSTLMLGGCRFILQSIAQPMVDMGMYLSLAGMAYLLTTRQWNYLCLWLPLMALSKEVVYPVLLLPLLLVPKEYRGRLAVSYLIAALLVWWVRHAVSAVSIAGIVSTADPAWSYASNSLFSVIAKHLQGASINLAYLFTPRGSFDILIAFGGLWPFMVHGSLCRSNRFPAWLWVLLPYALWCGLLSQHWGRMLTIAFPLASWLAAAGMDDWVRKAIHFDPPAGS